MKFEPNKLRIASPCHVSWESMSGDQKSRFCQSCQLNVYNLSEMTASEIKKLILQKEGRICGKLYKRADGTVITRDCPTGLRAVRRRVTRTASAVLAAFIGLCTVALGQSEKEKSCKVVSQGKIKRLESKSDLISIKGTITDLAGAVIPNAEIYLINDKTKQEIKIKTNKDGDFKLKDLPDGIYSARFSAANFKEYKISKLQLDKRENIKFEIALKSEVVVLLGVVAEESLIDVSSSGIKHVITRKMIESLPYKK
jgi:Carboxypeptidase regulatory-like domain